MLAKIESLVKKSKFWSQIKTMTKIKNSKIWFKIEMFRNLQLYFGVEYFTLGRYIKYRILNPIAYFLLQIEICHLANGIKNSDEKVF